MRRIMSVHSIILMLLLSPPALAGDRADASLPDAGDRFSEGSEASVSSQPWWASFDSSELGRLLDAGLEASPDLGTAMRQADQARALAAKGIAAFAPSVSLSSSLSIAPFESITFGGSSATYGGALATIYELLGQLAAQGLITGDPADFQTSQGSADTSDVFYSGSTQIGVSLPLDIWGAGAESWQAGRWDARAAAASAAAIQLSVSASIAGAWLDVVYQRARLQVIDDQIAAAEVILDLTETRYERGETSALDVLQQRQQLASLQPLQPVTDAQLQLAQQRLAIFLGRDPTDPPEVLTTELPALPPAPALGTPAQLVARSPAVLASSAQLAAAEHREKAAVRAALPSVALSAQYGPKYYKSGDAWVSDSFWGAGVSASLPLLAAGTTYNGMRAARAGADAAGHALHSAALRAVQQVEGALKLEAGRREQHAAVLLQRDAARASWQVALEQYQSGLIRYLSVLTAQQSLLMAELSALQSHRDLLDARIQLHAALGSVAEPTGALP